MLSSGLAPSSPTVAASAKVTAPATVGKSISSQFSPPARFGRLYRDELAKSKNVRVYLYVNAVDIEVDADRAIRAVRVKTLTGRTVVASAQIFVLATGGIENARLLLASNKARPNGLGNDNDLVGRYFMDHPRLSTGKIHFRKEWSGHMLYDVLFNYHNKALAAMGPALPRDTRLVRNCRPGLTERALLLFVPLYRAGHRSPGSARPHQTQAGTGCRV